MKDLRRYAAAVPWFGQQLLAARLRLRLTQQQVAKRAQVSVSRVSMAEGSMWPVRPTTVFKILDALELDPTAFEITLPSKAEHMSTGKAARPAGRPKKAREPVSAPYRVKRQRTGS
jgi:transcriptional regulator with XRE-family HTH domain